MDRRERIVAGVVGLLVLAWFVPDLVGVLLMLFSALVFVIAVVGLLRPSLVRIPDRMAAVWAFALSVGLFVGGGVLMSPENGEGTAMDSPRPTGLYLEHLNSEDRVTAEREMDLAVSEPDPCSLTAADMRGMAQTEIDRVWNACVEQQGGSAQVDAAAGISPELIDIEGMTHCNVRLQDAARVLYRDGALYRWTATETRRAVSRTDAVGRFVT